jgi:hypothetical protein
MTLGGCSTTVAALYVIFCQEMVTREIAHERIFVLQQAYDC